MRRLLRLPSCVPMLLTASLLAGCATKPSAPPLAVQPLLRIDDARAALAARAATATTPSAPAVAVTATVSTLPVVPSRMEIVQLGPNEYRLQYRQPTPAAAAASPVPAPASEAPLMIVNGNGVPGIAAQVRRLLRERGIVVKQVSNQRGYAQRNTVIDYLPGQQARARAVLAALHGHATLRPSRALPGGMALRLVLGHDHAARLAALGAAPDIRLAVLPPAVPHFNQE